MSLQNLPCVPIPLLGILLASKKRIQIVHGPTEQTLLDQMSRARQGVDGAASAQAADYTSARIAPERMSCKTRDGRHCRQGLCRWAATPVLHQAPSCNQKCIPLDPWCNLLRWPPYNKARWCPLRHNRESIDRDATLYCVVEKI